MALMDKEVAARVAARYQDVVGSGALNGQKAVSIVQAYLAAAGFERDQWGNYLSKDKKTRWHFKEQVVRRERKVDGRWAGLSSTLLLDAANNILLKAAEALGDAQLIARVQKGVETRAGQKEKRKVKAASDRDRREAKISALKVLSARHPARFVAAAASGFRGADAKVLADEMDVIAKEVLARIERGERAPGDGEIVSTKKPPVACFFQEQITYSWIESVDGHDYAIYFKPTGKGRCDVHIGKSSAGAFSPHVSAGSMSLSADVAALGAVGDGYISGSIEFRAGHDPAWRASLLLISSHDKQKGAGSRLMKLWCQLMGGYGIEHWVGLGVGPEGEAALKAWHRRGSLEIIGRDGTTFLVSCTHKGRSIFGRDGAEDPRQLRLPGMVRGRGARRRARR